MSDTGVRLGAVEKRFGEVVAVRSVDLDIPRGSFYSIIGPSGCGKTTTLRMIAGLESPDAGRIEVGGRDVTGVPAHRRPVNTVFQSYALFPHLDVFENVAFGLREARRPKSEIEDRVREMIDLVQLRGRERARPRELSGGQQQRVALARALINQPEVLLLDEPLGSLDLRLRKDMQAQLKDVQRRVGITFIYVTHDQEEAFSMSDGVAVMNAGILEQHGPPEAIYRRPATLFVADFVGTSNRLQGRVADDVGDGRYAVALPGGDCIETYGPSEARVGEQVSVIVRPEEVQVVRGSTGGVDAGDAFVARVEDVSYVGPQRHLRLASARLGSIVATVAGSAAPIETGDIVTVSWPAESAWFIRGSEPQISEEGASVGPVQSAHASAEA